MKRTAVLLLIITLFTAPAAFACEECTGTFDYQNIWQEWCQDSGGYGYVCTLHTRRVSCPDPNFIGPCYETTCRPSGVCGIVRNNPQPFGRPLVAAQVIAEMRERRGPVMAVAR